MGSPSRGKAMGAAVPCRRGDGLHAACPQPPPHPLSLAGVGARCPPPGLPRSRKVVGLGAALPPRCSPVAVGRWQPWPPPASPRRLSSPSPTPPVSTWGPNPAPAPTRCPPCGQLASAALRPPSAMGSSEGGPPAPPPWTLTQGGDGDGELGGARGALFAAEASGFGKERRRPGGAAAGPPPAPRLWGVPGDAASPPGPRGTGRLSYSQESGAKAKGHSL